MDECNSASILMGIFSAEEVSLREALIGVGGFTDPYVDLRADLEWQLTGQLQPFDLHGSRMGDLMKRNPKSVQPKMLAAEAVHVMETSHVTALPVIDAAGKLVGALNVHDLFRAGVM